MKRFLLIWAGQLVSVLGSGLTGFGLAVWIYLRTGSVADLALIAGAAYLPNVIVAPIGGVLADRLDRRWLMIVADSGSALATAVMLWCAGAGVLGPWTATALVFASASCNAMQWPAYEAAMVTLVPKAQLGRANGLCELSRGLSQLLAPLLAGALFGVIGIDGIILIDLLSFAVGVTSLLAVSIPRHLAVLEPATHRLRSMFADLASAWRYVVARRGLVAMLFLFSITNFTFAVVELLLKPLVLSFGSALDLGLVLSSVGVGMISGSLLMTAWGGPRRKVIGVLLFQIVEGSSLVVGGARPSLLLMSGAAFAYGFVIPIVFGCARTIWQVKVPHELQGRVTALRNAFVTLAIPLGYAAATPMASLLESAMAVDGVLASSVGAIIGVGEGRGSALVVIAMGVLTCASAVGAFAFGSYRRIEFVLADQIHEDAPV